MCQVNFPHNAKIKKLKYRVHVLTRVFHKVLGIIFDQCVSSTKPLCEHIACGIFMLSVCCFDMPIARVRGRQT
jgi:hypothetical protein